MINVFKRSSKTKIPENLLFFCLSASLKLLFILTFHSLKVLFTKKRVIYISITTNWICGVPYWLICSLFLEWIDQMICSVKYQKTGKYVDLVFLKSEITLKCLVFIWINSPKPKGPFFLLPRIMKIISKQSGFAVKILLTIFVVNQQNIWNFCLCKWTDMREHSDKRLSTSYCISEGWTDLRLMSHEVGGVQTVWNRRTTSLFFMSLHIIIIFAVN